MLYVFHVDSGRMMSFDMNLALETVQFLKDTIERHHAIPANSQVLLVSGGETLDAKSRVCSYTSGTDTNPIYMFSTNIDSRNPPNPWPSIETGNLETDSKKYNEMKKELDQCLELPATYNTVVRRAKLAQSICEMGKEELSKCEILVHEQHLQHQGWTAVIANMEDITVEFEKRSDNYYKRFEEHIERRNEYKVFLDEFDTDLGKLSDIPILTPLIQRAEDKPCHAFDEVYAEQKEAAAEIGAATTSNGSSSEASGGTSSNNSDPINLEKIPEIEEIKEKTSLTLLQWISSTENQRSLRRMAENCTRELDMFDKKVMNDLRADIQTTIDCARREDMKEIKGLEERLRGLENLMCDAKKIVQEQNELSTAFFQNQNRAANLGDTSILPDLCASHRSHLLVMLKNHKKLRDIRVRCAKAKDELGKNLHQRLKFVIRVENKMYEIDNTLLFYHRCLRRLQTHLAIIEQIHQAPCIYVQAVTEVVRRRIFSSAYLMWASDLACHLLSIYNEEVMRRQEFKHDFEGHFLSTLFPGIDDFPPRFATEAPSIFDSSLPNLTRDDLNELANYLPEITEKIQLPNLDAVIDFFSSRPFKSSTEKSLETDKSSGEKSSLSNKKLLNVCSQIKDYEKELESETDTEDYEKIGQTSTTATADQTVVVPPQNVDLRNVSVDATNLFQKCDISTSTNQVSTRESETLTEVRLENFKEMIKSFKNRGLSSMRVSKSLHELSSSSLLPSIPESLTLTKKFDTEIVGEDESDIEIKSYGTAKSDDDLTNNKSIAILNDPEFINSEFYIDESMPSSLNSQDGHSESTENGSATAHLKNLLMKTNKCFDTNKICLLPIDDDNDKRIKVITLLQDNLGTTRLEVERLKKIIILLHQTSNEALNLLKNQINLLKIDAANEKLALQKSLDELSNSFGCLKRETETRERELIHRLTVDHELEMNDLRKNLYERDDEIASLKNEKIYLEKEMLSVASNATIEKEEMQKKMDNLMEKIKELESKLQQANHEKEMAVKDIKEKMQHEHRNEIESLRCKFKMITTTMERSPSDTSLEKIERPDMLDLMDHEAIINQMRENFEHEKELAIKKALEMERQKSQQPESASSPGKSPSGNQEILRRILDEKERQLEAAREREQYIMKENMRLKDTIQSLADSEMNESQVSIITERLNLSQRENERLTKELEKEKNKRQKMLSTSQSITGVTVNSCSKDDSVLVAYNSVHNQYTVVQDSSLLFFLHAESYKGLNLMPLQPNVVPEICYCIGKVTDKEYCHAKKDENRYKVGKGTKFYRVKVRPRSPTRDMDKSSLERRRRRDAKERHSVSESTILERSVAMESSHFERQLSTTSQLIDSFAQTEMINLGASTSSSSHDMIDSGVDSQLNKTSGIFKERNISVTEEDEPLSLNDPQIRYKGDDDDDIEREIVSDGGKKDEDEVEGLVELNPQMAECTTDSEEFRSLETKEDDTEL